MESNPLLQWLLQAFLALTVSVLCKSSTKQEPPGAVPRTEPKSCR